MICSTDRLLEYPFGAVRCCAQAIRYDSRPKEAEEAQELGIDLDGVKSPDGFANALVPWIEALGEVRPDLLISSRGIWRKRKA